MGKSQQAITRRPSLSSYVVTIGYYFYFLLNHLSLGGMVSKGRTQKTITIGGRITVQLISSLTRLELTNEGNIILCVFSEAV